jgi:hypothetical protein
MDNKNFVDLVDKDEYQVFVLCCPAYFPFNFFRHPWFVINKKGEISRWEVQHFLNKENKSYLYKNFRKPFEGIEMTFFIKRKYKANLLGSLDGPIAEKVIKCIEDSQSNYPYRNKYSLIGPNSNTYIQWVLDQFPEFKIKLSFRFIGKNYK